MATGTPCSKKINDISYETSKIELMFPGKLSVEEILSTVPATLQAVISSTGNKRLYYGDNLPVLASLANEKELDGKIKLIYIDPPYATQTVFHSRTLTHAYEDVFETAEYLAFLRERVIFLHRLLAEDGSIYLHIDDKMLFHAKLIMDEIFGPANFRNCITRKKCNPKNYTKKVYGNVADYILFYTKSDKYVWNRQVEPWTSERSKEYQYVESGSGRKYMKVPVHAPGTRNGETGKPWRGVLPPPGKHWQFTPSTLDELDVKGEIFWSKNGNPRRKVYLDSSAGISVQDIWNDFRDAHNQNICITGYPTEKNPELLKRIVEASSNPGDIVLDCFAGSGTTLVAADQLGRNWIGIDNSIEALRTMLFRFKHGISPMGDFVSKPREPQSKSPTLFEVVSIQTNDENQEAKHEVKDFDLLTTPDNLIVVKRVAEKI